MRNLIWHTAFTYTIRSCSSMWVRLNRLDSSAVVRNIGSNTWGIYFGEGEGVGRCALFYALLLFQNIPLRLLLCRRPASRPLLLLRR